MLGVSSRRRRAARLSYPELLEDRRLLSGLPRLVKDINFATSASRPRDPVTIGDMTYFGADDGVHGLQLWKTNGTAAGTAMVKDIPAGPRGTVLFDLTAVGDTLFFA